MPRAGRPPTIRDVAALAGVSMATVSRVLNESAVVAAETKGRVLRAVTQLDFVSSASARTVRPGVRSMTWGLLVDDVDSHYFGRLAEELDRAAHDHGSTLLISVTQKHFERERHLIKEMSSRRVDGLLVVPASGDKDGERGRTAMHGAPLVYLDRIPRGIAADVVTFDYYHALVELVEDLWQRGHRRIAFIGGEITEDPGSRRYAAYSDTLRRHGQALDDQLVSVGHNDAGTAHAAVLTMLQSRTPPTAVVTTTGGILLGLLHGVIEEGVEIEIVGSEDFGAGFLSPVPLTLVEADLSELARTAADLLAGRIDGSLPDQPVTRLLPTGQVRYPLRTSLER